MLAESEETVRSQSEQFDEVVYKLQKYESHTVTFPFFMCNNFEQTDIKFIETQALGSVEILHKLEHLLFGMTPFYKLLHGKV